MTGRQPEIERRHRERGAAPRAPDATIEQIFGPYEDYELVLGRNRLVLVPTGEWLWLDPLHETWERTGIGVGEVAFAELNGTLLVHRRPGAPPPRRDLGSDRWFVRTGATIAGPWPRDDVAERLAAGRLSERTWVRREGTAPWLRASILATAVQAPRLGLLVRAGPDVGRRFTVVGRATIGHRADVDLALEDVDAAGVITIAGQPDGSWRVAATGGRVFLNGALVGATDPIGPGDELHIGRTRIGVEAG